MKGVKNVWKHVIIPLFTIILSLAYLCCFSMYFLFIMEPYPDFFSEYPPCTKGFIFFAIHFILIIWFVSEINTEKINRKKICLIFFASIIPIFSYFAINNLKSKYYSTFTTEKWINYSKARYFMIDSLLEKNNLEGKSYETIQDLLGEGYSTYDLTGKEHIDKGDCGIEITNTDFPYELFYPSGTQIIGWGPDHDTYYFIVYFNKDKKVKETCFFHVMNEHRDY